VYIGVFLSGRRWKGENQKGRRDHVIPTASRALATWRYVVAIPRCRAVRLVAIALNFTFDVDIVRHW
jgi:hypothetical protein